MDKVETHAALLVTHQWPTFLGPVFTLVVRPGLPLQAIRQNGWLVDPELLDVEVLLAETHPTLAWFPEVGFEELTEQEYADGLVGAESFKLLSTSPRYLGVSS